MRLALLTISFAAFIVSGCGRDSQVEDKAEIVRLSWVDTAAPQEMANHDIAEKRYRLFRVCEYASSCEIPGVGTMNAERCYPSIAKETIGAFLRPEEVSYELWRLTDKASKFSAQYNKFVAKSLADRGQRKCSDSADWDGAISALGGFLWREKKYDAFLWTSAEKPVIGISLKADVPTESILPGLCKILASHGLTSDATLSIVNDSPLSKDRAEHSYRCTD